MIKPSKNHRKVIYISTFLLWITGVAYLANRYTEQNLFDIFAPRSKLQTLAMEIHAAFALLGIYILGTLFTHIKSAWPLRKKRFSGILLNIFLTVLVVTIWPLYYASDEITREVSIAIHCIIGLGVPLFVIWHIYSKKI
jgi:hypothetical protein